MSKDVKIGGDASTVRQYLQAGQIDSPHLASVCEYPDFSEIVLESPNSGKP